jgi:glutathione S-transferase
MMKKNQAERDKNIIAETRAVLSQRLQYLETELGDKPYMLGEFSLVDIDIFPRFPRMESFGVIPSPSLPRLSAWYERMKQRPSVRPTL